MNIATLTLNPALDRSMLFEKFKAGELNRALSSVTTVGGKGINVSRVLKIFGINAPAYGFAGGENGESMKRMLDSEGVSYHFVPTCAQTRMNIKIVDKEGIATEASESGGPVSDEESKILLEHLDSLFSLQKDIKPEYFVISGSVPRGIDPSIYKTITQKAKAQGIKVILDCDREALRQGITACPFIIKPNKSELEQYAGRPLDTQNEIIDFALGLSAQFGVKTLLTMGEKGAMYIASDGVYRVNAPKVQMHGFTGAGDSFLAAFIATYDKTGDPAQSLRIAASFSAAKVELEGTLLPKKSEITKYLDVITAEKLR